MSKANTRDSAALRKRLRNVYWIGGGSAAGKSTVARRIAARHGLSVYSTDDVMADHARRSSPEACPLLHEFMAMDMDERWVNRTPATMLETFHWFKGEGFDMIIEDLLRLPCESGVIVEETQRLELSAVEVDEMMTEDELARRLASILKLSDT